MKSIRASAEHFSDLGIRHAFEGIGIIREKTKKFRTDRVVNGNEGF
jgi:hypothetical protein